MLKSKIQNREIIFYPVFFLILLIGFSVRVWDLGKNPAGFFCDEASIGYNAYSILKTGKDEHGVAFPLFFKAFGEYKNPLDIYFTIPFVAIFGLNEFSVRFSSVFFSFLSIIMFYFMGKLLLDKYFGLMLAAIFAINPWSIHFARVNLEGLNIFIFLLLVSLYFLIKYDKNDKKNDLIFFSIFSGIATYSYFPARIIVPIFFFVTTFTIMLVKRSKILFLSFMIFLFVTLPLIRHIIFGKGLSRWQQVSIFNQRKIAYLSKFSHSYLLHFSPQFLFLKGDIDMAGQFITRHSVRGVGEFYLWQLPFVILGLFHLLKRKNKFLIPIILLLILYPLASSLTADLPPQATRSISGIIPFNFFTGFGIWYFLTLLKKTNIYLKFVSHGLFLVIIIYSFVNFIRLLKNYPQYSSDYWGWQYGPKQIVNYFLAVKDNYNELYMTYHFNAPAIFFKFYDPAGRCGNCLIGGVERLNSRKKQLFALKNEEIEEVKKLYPKLSFKIKKIIPLPDGKAYFFIGEFF